MAESGGATISIEYCFECAYTLRALRAAEDLLLEYEPRIKQIALVPAGDGLFEVTVDGRLVFSRAKLGRHAEAGELVEKVGAALRP
jgi:selenoprotein W-related protein